MQTSGNRINDLLGMRDYLGTAVKAVEDALLSADTNDRRVKLYKLHLELENVLGEVCDELNDSSAEVMALGITV